MDRAIWRFVSVAYVLSIVLSVMVNVTGGYQSRWVGLGLLSMFVPTVAVVAVGDWRHGAWPIGWSGIPFRYVPLALFLIPATMHAAMLTRLNVAGSLPWAEWLRPGADGLYHTPASQGWGVLTRQELLVRLLANALVGVVVVSGLALFEEIGWRAWLLPRLAAHLGTRGAIVVSALIWGGWHLPLALSGIQHVQGISPGALAFSVPFGVTAAGVIIGWLWVKTGSIWIVALAHGAMNDWGQYAFKFMKDFTAPSPVSVLLTGSLALYAVGALLLLTVPANHDVDHAPPDFRPTRLAPEAHGL